MAEQENEKALKLSFKLADTVSKKLEAKINQCNYDILCSEYETSKIDSGAAKFSVKDFFGYMQTKFDYVWFAIKVNFFSFFYKESTPRKVRGDYQKIKNECQEKLTAIKSAKPRWYFWGDKNNFMLQVQVGREYIEDMEKSDLLPGRAEKQAYNKCFQDKMYMVAGAGCIKLVKELLGFKKLDEHEIILALQHAVQNGHIDVVEYLLLHLESNNYDIKKFLYLGYACIGGHVDMIKFLFKKGAKISAGDLINAAYYGNVDAVKWLLVKANEVISAYDIYKAKDYAQSQLKDLSMAGAKRPSYKKIISLLDAAEKKPARSEMSDGVLSSELQPDQGVQKWRSRSRNSNESEGANFCSIF